MSVERFEFSPAIFKENGLFIIDIDKVDAISFTVKERLVVSIPPKGLGGNHRHPRWEAFIGLGSGLKMTWQDDEGSNHEEAMNPDGKLFLFVISPNTPHVVVNNSETEQGILLEFADEEQRGVKLVELVRN